jgi:hypothetical protein
MDDLEHRPAAARVLARVWLAGLAWGAAGGAVLVVLWVGLNALGALLSGGLDVVSFGGGLLVTLWIAIFFGAPLGLVVGAVVGPVAAVLLLLLRPAGRSAPGLAWAASLAVAGSSAVAVLDGGGVPFVLAVCAVAAWPLWRTLHRAVRPAEASA